MFSHSKLNRPELRTMIRRGDIQFGGNCRLKICGTLACRSGKRLKQENRVFFASEKEAINTGYRPCSNCMHKKYLVWK
ncbi:MAG: Ada metal-binding domain-containing protein [Ferruginibacter sp.]